MVLRHYNIAGAVQGQRLPSVTTVLGQTQSKDKQASLQRWRDRVGHAEAAKVTQQAAARGTAMHKYLEDLIRGQRSLDLTDVGQQAQTWQK
jgi:hypothetical protein